MDTEKAYTQTKKLLGIVAVVATSLIVALDLMHKELCDSVEDTTSSEEQD